MAGNEEVTGAMAVEVLAPLARMRHRDSVLETLRSYLRLGSIAEVAETTYRHRNTVRNRLQSVEAATGLDLAVPTDAALLAMATEWLRSAAGQAFWRQRPPP